LKNLYALTVAGAGIAFGVAAAPCSLAAQAGSPAGIQLVAMQSAPVTVPNATGATGATAVGPTTERLAFHQTSPASRVMTDQDVGPHVNRGLAMTVAGIVLVGVGTAVKGGAGTAIAFGGGALSLYGIYNWIK
jgi:hypothetical protein